MAMFNSSICEGVAVGTCVMLRGNQIVYAGPIKTAPDVTGSLMLLSAADFEKLKFVVNGHKH